MATMIPHPTQPESLYPESDGQPVGENTVQFRYIMTIQGGLDALFAQNPEVFVAGDLFWYPVEGQPEIRVAPDALVVFGRPKGDRSAYLQWREGQIAPQVVFEILSPSNTAIEMLNKLAFYDRYGVEEYYLYDPEGKTLLGWQRREGHLAVVESLPGWVSPRLGVRFEVGGAGLELYRPDGQRLETYVEIAQRAEQAHLEKEQAHQRAEQLAARLRELGVDPEAL